MNRYGWNNKSEIQHVLNAACRHFGVGDAWEIMAQGKPAGKWLDKHFPGARFTPTRYRAWCAMSADGKRFIPFSLDLLDTLLEARKFFSAHGLAI